VLNVSSLACSCADDPNDQNKGFGITGIFGTWVDLSANLSAYTGDVLLAFRFGFLDNPALGNWVEHFPYQDGLLINYWDTSQRNNPVARHHGRGLLLPVDAHPAAMDRADGGVWRNRIETYDSTFGMEPTEALTLHWNSGESYHESQPAIPIFDDNNSYYDEANAWGSVIVPHTGTQICIQSISARDGFMQVQVRPSK
jgi:immune inhibitor A